MMARLYFSAGEIDKAEDALERVVVEAPDDPEGFVLLGDLALRAQRTAFAELAYDRATLILNHYDANADRQQNLRIRILAGLASVAESRGQYQRAASLLESWIEHEPKSPLAFGSLGRVSFYAEEYGESRTAFARLAEVVDTSPPVEIAMGRLFSENGMYDEAYDEMTAAVVKYADDSRVLLTVSDWAMNNGLLDYAQKTIADALKIDENSLEAQILLARLARYKDDHGTAENLLSALIPLRPNSVLLGDEFARTVAASADENKRKAAMQYAERNFRAMRKNKSPMMLQSIITYAWTLLKNGQAAKAEVVVQSMPDGSSISNENGYYVASIYAGRNKKDVAINMLESLLTEDRPFPMRHKAEQLLLSLKQD